MSLTVGSVIAKFQSDVTDFKKGLQSVQSDVGTFGSKTTEALKGMRNATLIASAAVTGIAVASLKLGETAGKYESIRDAFGSMTKEMGINVDEFEQRVAAATGGQLDNLTILTGATRGLSLIGKDAFNDFGSDFEKMAELSKKAARATGQDVNFMFDSLVLGISRESKMILDNLGISVDITQAKEDYAKSLGKSSDELTVSESKHAALTSTLAKLEETYGAVAVSSGGFSGNWAKVTTELTNFKIELGTALLPLLNQLGQDILPIVREHLPTFVSAISKLLTAFRDLDPKWQKLILAGLALTPVIAAILTIVTPLVSLIVTLAPAIAALVAAIASLGAPVLIVIAIIAALVAAGVLLYKNWDTIKEKAIEIFDAIKQKVEDFYNNSIKPILDAIGLAFTWLYEYAIKPAIDNIVSKIQFWVNIFTWLWQNILEPLLLLIKAGFLLVFYEISLVVETVTNKIKEVITTVLTAIWDFIKPWLDILLANITYIFNEVKKVTDQVWAWIKEHIIDNLVKIYNKVAEVAGGIYNTLKSNFDYVLNRVRETWGNIKDAIVKPFEEAKRKVEEIANKIRDLAEKINPYHRESPSLVDNVRKGVDAIKDAYGELGYTLNPPSLYGAGAAVGGTTVVVNLAGANITDPSIAEHYAELIGNQIMRKLARGTRV